MVKKVLITGSSGYIGSHLCKMLAGKYEVHGLDVNMPKAPVDRFYKQDINRIFDIDIEYDAVIHLAALVRVGESELSPIKYYITNLNGTMNVINKIKTKNFIFPLETSRYAVADLRDRKQLRVYIQKSRSRSRRHLLASSIEHILVTTP